MRILNWIHTDNSTRGLQMFYRVEGVKYARPVDEFGDVRTDVRGSIEIIAYEFPVLYHTEKGTWIKYPDNPSKKKFILRDAHKHYACPTIELALESYIARKERQISIYQARIETWDRLRALAVVELAKERKEEIDQDELRHAKYGLKLKPRIWRN